MKPDHTRAILFSGGAAGAEAAFGAAAVRHRGVRMLNHEELESGDVSLEYVSRLMNRRYTEGPTIRKILQTLWYQVNAGQEIYVIGTILPDNTVRGGTGWGAEFAKLCNKPLFVFDQARDAWCQWAGREWQTLGAPGGPGAPVVTHPHFTGTGTRSLEPNGRQAIEQLFQRSFD